jgi:hypothetical protein
MAEQTDNSVDEGHHLGERIIDVLNDVGAEDDERVLALLSVLEFTIAVVECPGCQKTDDQGRCGKRSRTCFATSRASRRGQRGTRLCPIDSARRALGPSDYTDDNLRI